MRVLVIGGGAREHAICSALKDSDAEIYSFMKNSNPGIKRIAKDYFLHDECDAEKVVSYALSKNIELAIVGPEAPLQEGVTNLLIENGIPTASPTREAAEIETDKEFMRKLMKKYRIKGRVKWGVFSDEKSAEEFINKFEGNVAVKPVGLTGGKGVKVYGSHFNSTIEAIEYAKEVISKKIGGKSRVLIEEKVIGEEFTLQAFCDGKNVFPMPLVQDYKRLLPNDEGPNTGGMGSISSKDFLLPFIEKDEYEEACLILQKIIEALKKEGGEYRGVIYGQFMLSPEGVRVIEINARFGDREAMNVLSILRTNFLEICNAMASGKLRNNMVGFHEKSTVCKYVVPCGYGYQPIENKEIKVDERKIEEEGGKIFYASVNEENGKIYTTKSRSLAILGIANEIYEAEEICDRCLKYVEGDIFFRHDIGKKESIERKMMKMNMLRG